jgi:hypothetical protein
LHGSTVTRPPRRKDLQARLKEILPDKARILVTKLSTFVLNLSNCKDIF